MMVIYTSDFRLSGVSGCESAESSGMVSRMTPTPPPSPAGQFAPTARTGEPLGGGVGPLTAERVAEIFGVSFAAALFPAPRWFLAACFRCGGDDFAEPFRDDAARDDWAAKHVESTGHAVKLSTHGADFATMLSRTDHPDGFKTLCTGIGRFCRRWTGPFDTPQIALASSRDHVCESAR